MMKKKKFDWRELNEYVAPRLVKNSRIDAPTRVFFVVVL